jgi:lipoyl(octanoyl) transferase
MNTVFQSENLIIKSFDDKMPYEQILKNMQSHTQNKIDNKKNNYPKKICNEIWLLEHKPVYTQGRNGKPEHILNKNHIPIVQTDRGGQVTYHGPGQLMVYFLLDLRSINIGPRDLVHKIENIIIKLLQQYDIPAEAREDAPGIYINNPESELHNSKICSIGLRIKQGHSYHGIALNINMDLAPFNDINPCGYEDMKVSQIKDFISNIKVGNIKENILKILPSEFKI